jgi:hypothetical protein
MLRTASSLPPGAFDAGLRPRPFPDEAASLLPGLLAATRTGLPPAGDDELTNTKKHHALRHGATSCSAGRTKKAHCAASLVTRRCLTALSNSISSSYHTPLEPQLLGTRQQSSLRKEISLNERLMVASSSPWGRADLPGQQPDNPHATA